MSVCGQLCFVSICCKAADGFEGFFLFGVQFPDSLRIGPVGVDAVANDLGHGDTLFQSDSLQPFYLLGLELDLGSDHCCWLRVRGSGLACLSSVAGLGFSWFYLFGSFNWSDWLY
jgi:hypothetical protein